MIYTKELTFKELKTNVERIAKEYGFKMTVQKLDKSYSSDGKISTIIKVYSNKCEIEFYDYKMTNLYSDSKKSPTAFRRSKYNWHVQSNDKLIEAPFKELMEA